MPYSHSVLTVLGAMLWCGQWELSSVERASARSSASQYCRISSSIVDAQRRHRPGPIYGAPKYGTFLYGRLAPVAFLVELAYGLVCWWIFRGGKALLAVVLGFNLANISEFFRSIPGPEDALAATLWHLSPSSLSRSS